jgi:hypothetical protein
MATSEATPTPTPTNTLQRPAHQHVEEVPHRVTTSITVRVTLPFKRLVLGSQRSDPSTHSCGSCSIATDCCAANQAANCYVESISPPLMSLLICMACSRQDAVPYAQ